MTSEMAILGLMQALVVPVLIFTYCNRTLIYFHGNKLSKTPHGIAFYAMFHFSQVLITRLGLLLPLYSCTQAESLLREFSIKAYMLIYPLKKCQEESLTIDGPMLGIRLNAKNVSYSYWGIEKELPLVDSALWDYRDQKNGYTWETIRKRLDFTMTHRRSFDGCTQS